MKYLGIDFGTSRIGIASSDEAGEFAFPKFSSSLRHFVVAALMQMPETAMDKDYGAVLGKYKVRLARQPLVMKDITKALGVQASSYNHFRLGILAADARHHPASDLGRNDISHKPLARHGSLLQNWESTSILVGGRHGGGSDSGRAAKRTDAQDA